MNKSKGLLKMLDLLKMLAILSQKDNWRTKQALRGEVDGKHCIAAHARIWLLVGIYVTTACINVAT